MQNAGVANSQRLIVRKLDAIKFYELLNFMSYFAKTSLDGRLNERRRGSFFFSTCRCTSLRFILFLRA